MEVTYFAGAPAADPFFTFPDPGFVPQPPFGPGPDRADRKGSGAFEDGLFVEFDPNPFVGLAGQKPVDVGAWGNVNPIDSDQKEANAQRVPEDCQL